MRFRCISLLLLIFFLLLGCTARSPAAKPEILNPQVPESRQQPETEQKSNVKLPWEQDPLFRKALNEHGTPILMASYQATLPDPILQERENITLGAKYLSGQVVHPGAVFSLNKGIGQRSAARGFKPGPMYSGGRIVPVTGGGVCKIASLLYNVTILANLEIVERHPHSMTVPYVPPGQDATISYGTKDFKFRNNTASPLLIWAENRSGTLYMAIYGTAEPPRVSWVHKTLSQSDTWTEYVDDPSLPKGVHKLVFEGHKGITVQSHIIITTKDGQETIKNLGISAYRPGPRIVARGR